MSHFIVVYKFKKNKLVIADPAKNNKSISLADFSKIYDGVVVLIKPNSDFIASKNKNNGILTKFLKLLTPHKKLFIAAIVSSLLLTIMCLVGFKVYLEVLI